MSNIIHNLKVNAKYVFCCWKLQILFSALCLLQPAMSCYRADETKLIRRERTLILLRTRSPNAHFATAKHHWLSYLSPGEPRHPSFIYIYIFIIYLLCIYSIQHLLGWFHSRKVGWFSAGPAKEPLNLGELEIVHQTAHSWNQAVLGG